MCHVDAYATLNAFLGNCTATRHHVSENSQIIHVSTSYVQPIHLAVIYIQHALESRIVVHKIYMCIIIHVQGCSQQYLHAYYIITIFTCILYYTQSLYS